MTGETRTRTDVPSRRLLRRVADHVRNGTLLERLQQSIQPLRERWREAWWRGHRGEANSLLYPLQSGVQIRLHLDSELCREIYCRNFESSERAFLNMFLRPGDVFVDIGANIGLFTLIAARLVGQRGRVLAFEPTARTFARLEDNVRTNNLANVQCFQRALSDRAERRELVQAGDGWDAWNSIGRRTTGSACATETVQTACWDDIVREQRLDGAVTMMKIDVEGWEQHVLAGAKRALSRRDAPVLQVEFADATATAKGTACRDLYQTLEDLGYQMFVFDPSQRILVADPLRDEYSYANLVATKDADMVNARLRRARRHVLDVLFDHHVDTRHRAEPCRAER